MHTETAEPKRYQCRHIFTGGRRCGSPSLRNEHFCYFHHTTRGAQAQPAARRRRTSTFTLPPLEDHSAVQLALGEVLQRLAANQLDPRRAGLLLYGLQIASRNLKNDRNNDQNNDRGSRNRDEHSASVATVSEITHDPILGTLAPPAELGADQPKGTMTQLLEYFDSIPPPTPQETPGHTSQPAARPAFETYEAREAFEAIEALLPTVRALARPTRCIPQRRRQQPPAQPAAPQPKPTLSSAQLAPSGSRTDAHAGPLIAVLLRRVEPA